MIKRGKTAILAMTVVLGILLCACSSKAKFDGSKTGDSSRFDIDFEMLNTSYSHDLDMKAGEDIEVSVTRTSGKISVRIQKGDEDPIYRGDNMESSNFKVGIKEDGKYTVTVTGEDAKGHVVFFRRDYATGLVPTAEVPGTDETAGNATPAPADETTGTPTPDATPTTETAPADESAAGTLATAEPTFSLSSEHLSVLPDSIQNVFSEGGEFEYTGDYYDGVHAHTRYTLASYQPYMAGFENAEEAEGFRAFPKEYTIIDLDGDGKNEIVLRVESKEHGRADYLILSDVNGNAYGYVMVYRGLNPLYADGRAWGSSGASWNDLYRFTAFTVNGFEQELLAYEHDPSSEIEYNIAGTNVSKEQFYAFCKEIELQPLATWFEVPDSAD